MSCRLLELAQALCDTTFGAIEAGQVYVGPAGMILHSGTPGLDLLMQHLADAHGVHPQLACAGPHKLIIGDAAVATAAGDALQLVVEPAQYTRLTVRLKPQTGRYGVSRFKADAGDLARDLVRMILEHVRRERAVFLVDARCECPGYAVVLEPEHDLAQLRLRIIRFRYLFRRLLANATDLSQTMRMLLDDIQRPAAELLHDAVSDGRATALDEPRGQEPLDALGTRRGLDMNAGRPELLAEFRMNGPAARHMDDLPDERSSSRDCHGHATSLARGRQLEHGEFPLRTVKYDPLDRALDFLGDVSQLIAAEQRQLVIILPHRISPPPSDVPIWHSAPRSPVPSPHTRRPPARSPPGRPARRADSSHTRCP